MKTLVAYPNVIRQAEAFKQLENGKIWGPLWPFHPAEVRGHYRPRVTEAITLPAGETFEEYVKRAAGGYTIETAVLNAGEYYPRIWRGIPHVEQFGKPVLRVEETPFFGSFVNSLEQVEGLLYELSALFRVVHPAMDENLNAYGGAIRNIIILACTEVEAQWRAVLEANGVKPKNGDYTTKDYVKLKAVMKLEWYSVALMRYPQLKPVAPFMGWDKKKPSKSLTWYAAYNNVKHDREANFRQAALVHAIEAVAACVVMLAAQFGVESLQRNRLDSVFEFREQPYSWPREWYFEPVAGEDWKIVRYAM